MEDVPSWIQAAIATAIFVGTIVWRFASHDGRIAAAERDILVQRDDHDKTVEILNQTVLIVAKLEERTNH
jgi:hypothetical protein